MPKTIDCRLALQELNLVEKTPLSSDNATVVTASHQLTTTTYNLKDLTIKEIFGVATQTPMLLDVGHFKALWDRLLTPETHSGAQNNSSGSVQNSNAAQGLLDRLELMQNFQPGSGSTDNTERVRNSRN